VARRGSVRVAVDRELEQLCEPDATLVALAQGLAAAFDREPAAAVARELRATLQALRASGDVDRQSAAVLQIRGAAAVGDAS